MSNGTMNAGMTVTAQGEKPVYVLWPLILYLALFFALWTVRATTLYAVDEAIASDTWRGLYSNIVKLVVWVLSAFAFARWVRGASPWRYLGFAVSPPLRQWLWCLGVTVLYLAASAGLAVILGWRSFSPQNAASHLTVAGALSLGISPLLEEILFRGLVLKELSQVVSAWLANALASLLFVAIHLPFWLQHGGAEMTLATNIVGVGLLGLLAGYLYLRSGSVWPPYCAHVANNAAASLLVTG